MKTFILLIAILVVAAFAYYGFKALNKPATLPLTNTQPTQPVVTSPESTTSQNVKSFMVEGKPFEFNPKEIKVKKGDTVKITFKNNEEFHNLTIDGYNVGTKQINAGESDTIQFVADKAGTFEFFCNVDGHKDKGMVGNLIVE